MNKVIFLIIAMAFAFAVGCSGSSTVPTQPGNPDFPDVESSSGDAKLLYTGTFDIDIDNLSITQSNSRQSEVVYDITGFLPDKCPGGCFRFSIIGIVGTVIEIELTIENPLAIQVYDVIIEYIELFGKSVLNPDSYTDFAGTPITDFYPFTAFMKESADRAFPIGPGSIDTETLFLDFPPGSSSSVHYAITASLPDQTGAPYEISEMAQTGELTSSGGSAEISCKVDDHQDNVSAVFLDATPFTGGPVQMLPDPLNPGYYMVEISNTAGAPLGIYTQAIMALSPNPQNISTYNYVEVTVNECGDTLTSWDKSLPNMSTGRYYSGHVQIGNQLWIIGGRYLTSVEVFDLDSETWDSTPRAPMPGARDAFACSHYDGKIYCMGGYYTEHLGTQVVYDIASDTWDTSHPDMPGDPRNVLKSVTYQDEIYLCFGYNWHFEGRYKRLDIYDPVAQTWRRGADANYGRTAPTWLVVGDRIYAMGNNASSDPGANRIEYYEPASDTWTLLSTTMSRWRAGPGFVAINEKIYLMGGHENTENSYNWVDSFDTTTEIWTQEIDLPEDRGFNPATAYYECKIYLTAGRGDSYVNLRSVRAGIFE